MKSHKKAFKVFLSGIGVSCLGLYLFGNNYPIISWFGVITTFSLHTLYGIIEGRKDEKEED